MVWPAAVTVGGLGVLVTAMDAGVLVKVQTRDAPALPLGAGKGTSKLVPVPFENGTDPFRHDHVVE